jgi:Coenzyme PQQ synthesis protein D (PqqD)
MVTETVSFVEGLEWQMAVFRVNEPDVVYETFDEEVVVVNLDTGKYYSLSGTGPAIWVDLVDGFGIDEIARRIQNRHIGEFGVFAAAVTAFADRLVNDKLLVRVGNAVSRPLIASEEPAAGKTPFAAPIIENYDDMQDLLRLDPIHEVDPAGWPVEKKNPG